MWIVAAVLAICFVQTPRWFLHGFIYCEEGTAYLRYAWDARPEMALFAPHQGYYSLVPNVCTLLAARVLPIAWAAHFLALSALAVRLLILYFAATVEVFSTRTQRVLAVGVLLLVHGSGEITSGTINSQFLLAGCAGLLLVSDAERRVALRRTLLVLAGLDGVLSCFLLPWFAWKAYKGRSRGAVWECVLLATATVAQAWAVVVSRRYQSGFRPRHTVAGVLNAMFEHLGLMLFGTRIAGHFGGGFLVRHAGVLQWPVALLAVAGLAGVGVLLHRTSRAALTLYGAGLAVTVLSAANATGDDSVLVAGGGGRYFAAGCLMLGWALVMAAREGQRDGRTRMARGLVYLLLISGVSEYAATWRKTQSGPLWRPQVRAWEADASTPLRMCPDFWAKQPIELRAEHADATVPFYLYDSSYVRPVEGR